MTVTIRESAKQDAAGIETVKGLAFAAVRTIYRPKPHAVAKAAQRTDVGELVAVEGEEVVGVVRYREQDHRLHLIGLAVHPDHQRCGIARQLVEHLADIAKKRGLKEMSLYTIEQTGNVPIFEKLGFAVVARTTPLGLESVTGQPLTEAFMVKPV